MAKQRRKNGMTVSLSLNGGTIDLSHILPIAGFAMEWSKSWSANWSTKSPASTVPASPKPSEPTPLEKKLAELESDAERLLELERCLKWQKDHMPHPNDDPREIALANQYISYLERLMERYASA